MHDLFPTLQDSAQLLAQVLAKYTGLSNGSEWFQNVQVFSRARCCDLCLVWALLTWLTAIQAWGCSQVIEQGLLLSSGSRKVICQSHKANGRSKIQTNVCLYSEFALLKKS